jgi:hypothetical protein
MDTLVVFLVADGVAPSTGIAERIMRFADLWRQTSQGTNYASFIGADRETP